MTYAEIVTAVEAILISTPSATATYIDTALHSAQRKLDDAKIFKCSYGASTLNSESQASYGIFGISAITQFNGPRSAPRWIDGEDGWHEMKWADTGVDIYRLYSVYLAEGPPEIAVANLFGGDTIVVFPVPDEKNTTANGSYDITFTYWQRLFVLSNIVGFTTNWFSENCEDYLVWKTASECFLFDRAYNDYAIWGAKADAEFKRLVKTARREQFTGTVLKVRTDANAASTQGRR